MSAAAARRAVGVVVPSSNAVLEEDLRTLLHPDFGVLGARVGSGRDLSVQLLEAMAADAEQEAAKLAEAGVAAIGYGCTSGSFFAGSQYDTALAAALARASGAAVTTASTAAVAALRRLSARRIGFASPYPEEMHRRGRDFFAAAGFDVVADGCLGIADNHVIAAISDDDLSALVARTAVGADAVFLSCTGLPTAQRTNLLSAAAGVPVATSNQALADALRLLADDQGAAS